MWTRYYNYLLAVFVQLCQDRAVRFNLLSKKIGSSHQEFRLMFVLAIVGTKGQGLPL